MADLNTFGKVKNKILEVAGQKPAVGSLGIGEIAINLVDGVIFAGEDGGAIKTIGLSDFAAKALVGAVGDIQDELGAKLNYRDYNEFPRSYYNYLDFDNAVDAGMYRLPSSSAGMNHAPSSSSTWNSGVLLVIHGASTTVAQVVFSYTSNSIAFRSGNTHTIGSGTWTDWQTLIHSGNVSNRALRGDQLTNTADFDTMYSAGVFRVVSTSDAGAINGIPTTAAGVLVVSEIYGTDGTSSVQTYTTTGGYTVFMRKSIQDANGDWVWNDWVRILTTNDLLDQANNQTVNCSWQKISDTECVLSILVPKALEAGDKVTASVDISGVWDGASNTNYDSYPFYAEVACLRKATTGTGYLSAPVYLPQSKNMPNSAIGDIILSEGLTAVSGQPQTILAITFTFKDAATNKSLSDSETLTGYVQIKSGNANAAPV